MTREALTQFVADTIISFGISSWNLQPTCSLVSWLRSTSSPASLPPGSDGYSPH